MADSAEHEVHGSLMRKVWSYVEIPFAIVGVVASVLGIIQGTSWLFLEKKAISAAYKYEVLAQDGSIFGTRLFLDPNISDWKKIVQVSAIIWNSGNETIEPKDVRRDVAITLDASSKVIDIHPGMQNSNKPDDFKFHDSGKNSYKLTWDVLDPNDFFETHFLVGTNLDKDSLKKIIQVEGLISGNTKLVFREMSTINILRNNTAVGLGLLLLAPLLISIVFWTNQNKRVKAYLTSLKDRYQILLTAAIGISCVIFCVLVAQLMASYFWHVPSWLEPGIHLEVITAK